MSKSLKYYPIGTVVIYDNRLLRLTEQEGNEPSCAGCYFNNTQYRKYNNGKTIACITHGMACTKHVRRDKKHVYFKLIKT